MSDGIAAPEGTTAPTTAAQASSILSGLATKDPASAPPSAPPAAAATPPAPSGTWRDKLPDDLKADPNVGKFDSEEALARSYIGLQKMLGSDKVPVPRSEDDQEGWDRFYAAAGRPPEPTGEKGYKYEPPKDMPEGITFDESRVDYVKQVAHKNGWNQRQFSNAMKELYEDQVKAHAQWQKSQADSRAEAERALQLTGDREETMTLAKATVQQYFDQDALSRLEAAGLGNDPIIIRTFAKIGKDLTGHQVLKGRGGEPVKTMEQMKMEASEFLTANQAIFHDPSHPDRKAKLDQYQAMLSKMYPENAA